MSAASLHLVLVGPVDPRWTFLPGLVPVTPQPHLIFRLNYPPCLLASYLFQACCESSEQWPLLASHPTYPSFWLALRGSEVAELLYSRQHVDFTWYVNKLWLSYCTSKEHYIFCILPLCRFSIQSFKSRTVLTASCVCFCFSWFFTDALGAVWWRRGGL